MFKELGEGLLAVHEHKQLKRLMKDLKAKKGHKVLKENKNNGRFKSKRS